jgi:hypothetical protein
MSVAESGSEFDPETRYRYSDLRTTAKLERRFTRRVINFEEFE